MPRYEFQCTGCERLDDVHAAFDEPVPGDHPCGARIITSVEVDHRPRLLSSGLIAGTVTGERTCEGTMRRVWGVPAIGRGTSGQTPARGRQRFLKGDAGWTNG